MGGAEVGPPPVSWAGSLDYVFPFDDPADLGKSIGAVTTGLDYAQHTAVTFEAQDVAVGAGAIQIGDTNDDGPSALVFPDVAPGVFAPMTLGMWMRPSSTCIGSIRVAGRHHNTNNHGYGLIRGTANANAAVVLGIDVDDEFLTSPGGTVIADVYKHVVVRVTADGEAEAFLDGLSFAQLSVIGLTPAAAAFIIGNATSNDMVQYRGAIDEVFLTTEALDDLSIRRIWACGVDGSGCVCDRDDSAAYASCGPAPGCASLPPCDAPAPTPIGGG